MTGLYRSASSEEPARRGTGFADVAWLNVFPACPRYREARIDWDEKQGTFTHKVTVRYSQAFPQPLDCERDPQRHITTDVIRRYHAKRLSRICGSLSGQFTEGPLVFTLKGNAKHDPQEAFP